MVYNIDRSYHELHTYLNIKKHGKNLEEAIGHLYRSLDLCPTFENHLYMTLEFYEAFSPRIQENRLLINHLYSIVNRLGADIYAIYEELDKIYPLLPNKSNKKLSGEEYFKIAEAINYCLITGIEETLQPDDLVLAWSFRDVCISKAIAFDFTEAYGAKAYYEFKKGRYYFIIHGKRNEDFDNECFRYAQWGVEKGSTKALYYLALCYKNGMGTKVDYEKAIEYFVLSMKKNPNTTAPEINSLATLYFVLGEYEKSIEYLRLGVEKEKPNCMYNLAVMKYDGEYIERDIDGAVNLLEKISKMKLAITEQRIYKDLAVSKLASIAFSDGLLDKSESYLNNILQSPFISDVQERLDHVTDIKNNAAWTRKEIKPSLNIEKYENEIIKEFGDSYHKLQFSTKQHLINSQIMLEACQNHFQLLDYSPIVLNLFKGLEIELDSNFYSGYFNYLTKIPSEYVISKIYYYKDKQNRLQLKKNLDNFVLGKFVMIVFNSYEMDKEIFRQSGFYYYLTNEYISSDYRDEGLDYWFSYFNNLESTIRTIRDDYRNPSLHSRIMNYTEMETCRDYMIRIKKVLVEIVKIKK